MANAPARSLLVSSGMSTPVDSLPFPFQLRTSQWAFASLATAGRRKARKKKPVTPLTERKRAQMAALSADISKRLERMTAIVAGTMGEKHLAKGFVRMTIEQKSNGGPAVLRGRIVIRLLDDDGRCIGTYVEDPPGVFQLY